MKMSSFSRTKLLAVVAGIAVVGVSFLLIQDSDAKNSTYSGPPKAIIIDQLYDEIPSKRFHDMATQYLETGGYEVDIITTQNVTVDFFKKLPQMNYNYVIIRTHGVLDASADAPVVLFTGEKYTTESYIQEQLFGQIKKGTPLANINYQLGEHDSSDWIQINETARSITTPVQHEELSEDEYFLIPTKFVDEVMEGQFPETIFLLGGCKTMANPSMAKSLINRGASSVVGWDENVGSYDNDNALLRIIEENVVNKLEIVDAVELVKNDMRWTNNELQPNLEYYSESM